MLDNIPPEVRTGMAGAAGSLLAMFFMRRPLVQLLGVFVGGCAISLFATDWVAAWLGMTGERGLVGFLLGTFGMSTVGKVFDTIEAVNPAELWAALKDAVRKRLGV